MRVRRKDIFLAKLFLASSVLHGIIFFCCFFLARGDRFTQRVDFSMLHHQQVVFLPFQKSVRMHSKGGGARGGLGESVAITPQAAQLPVASKTTITKPSARRGKKGKGNTKGQQAKKSKEVHNEKKKQALEKAAEQDKQHDTQQLAKAEPAIAPTGDPNAPVTSEPIYLGQNDLDNLEIAQSIREEVANVWRPPAGLGAGKQCKVKVVVDWDGAIKELTIEEPSHIAAFDVSVRLAVQQMKFPKAVFGKEIILPFAA